MAHGSRLTAHGEIAHSQDLAENSDLNPNSNLKKLSVIIPAYNVEKFLRKCVDSVVNQTYKNIEIIIVDDGSTDSTPQICDELEKEHENIIVIHQENQGLTKVREIGIRNSTGEYIAFIDSDDYIDVTAYEKAIKVLEENDCDMVQFGWYLVNPDGESFREARKPSITTNTARDLYAYFLTTEDATWSMCDKVFKRHQFDNIEWLKITMAEDYCLCAQLFAKTQKFISLSEQFYYYVKNPDSICHQSYTNKAKRDDIIKAENFVVDFTEKHFPEFLPEALLKKLSIMQLIFNEYIFSDCSDKEEVLKQIKNDLRKDYERMQSALKKQKRGGFNRYTFKDRARNWLFAYCPNLAVLYLKIRLKIHALTGI